MRNLLFALSFFALAAFAQDPPGKLMQGADNMLENFARPLLQDIRRTAA